MDAQRQLVHGLGPPRHVLNTRRSRRSGQIQGLRKPKNPRRRGEAMKKPMLLILAVLLLNGCEQYKKLIGEKDDGPRPEEIQGTWTGDIETPDWGPGEPPRTQTLTLRIDQGGENIMTGSLIRMD